LLGQATTDPAGHYAIQYTAAQFQRAEKQRADLIFRLFDAAGHPLTNFTAADEAGKPFRMLPVRNGSDNSTTIPIVFQAQPEETINFVVVPVPVSMPSEYDQLLEILEPLLVNVVIAGNRQPTLLDQLADLTAEDIDFLTGETDIPRQRLAFLVTAATLQQQAAAQHFVVPAAAFYGLAREGLPLDLAALGLKSQRARSDALDKALTDNLIPATLRAALTRILDQLHQFVVGHVLTAPPAPGRSSLGALLGTFIPAPAQQATFLTAYANYDGPRQKFWTEELPKQPGFQDPREIHKVQLALQLGMLTQNHVPLIQAVQRTRPLTAVRDLVQLDTAAWTALVTQPTVGVPPDVPGRTPQEQVTNYVNMIVGTLKAALPTAYVGLGLASAPAVDLRLTKQVLASHPGLDPGQPLPDDFDWSGIEPADRAQAQASMEALRREIQMFPGFDYAAALAATSTGLQNPIRQGVAQFFVNEPDFEFANTHIDTYLTTHAATAFKGIPERDRAAVTTQLKALQRTFRVASSYEHMQTLMGEGLDSAYAITSIPQGTFVQLFGSKLGGTMLAQSYYAAAQHIKSTNTHMYTSAMLALKDVTPMVIGGVPDTLKPNLTTLFGRLDLCDCEHCHSVYSPAAYFVDLLQFLNPKAWDPVFGENGSGKKPGKKAMKRPLEVLLARRPDLQHIKLTCENTNTPLPYVDLVNEILEYYVAFGSLSPADPKAPPLAKDTADATAEELSVNPQYTIDAAYDKVKQAVYPLRLPYNQPVAVARAYLGQLGASRHEVMHSFQVNQEPADLDIACEYLGMVPEERDILLAQSPKRLAEFYGYAASTSPTALVTALQPVLVFMQRTGLHYLDLIELIKTRFINPAQGTPRGMTLDTPTTVPDPSDPTKPIPVDPCDLSHTTIKNLDQAALQKSYRFLRLWRILGWPMHHLDLAMTVLHADDITPGFVQQLAQIKHLQEALSLPDVRMVLSLWGPIDTNGEDSLYAKLFLSKAALHIDPVFEPQPDGAILSDPRLTITAHVPAILAALRVRDTDLAAIRADVRLAADDAPLTLATVSVLYRYAVLAKALKLQVPELIALKTLSGVNPFSVLQSNGQFGNIDPASTLHFVELSRTVQQSGWKIAQLNYLYRHVTESPNSMTLPRERLLQLVRTLREGLRRIATESYPTEDPAGESTRTQLATLFENTVVDQTIRMLDGSAIYTTPLEQLPAGLAKCNPAKTAVIGIDETKIPDDALRPKIAYDPTATVLQFTGPMTTAESTTLLGLLAALNLPPDPDFQQAIQDLFAQPRTFIADTLSGFLAPAGAGTELLEKPSLDKDGKPVLLDKDGKPVVEAQQTPVTTVIAEKFAYVLTRLVPFLRDTLSHNLVKQTLSDALKVDAGTTAVLTETLLKSLADPTKPIIHDALALRTAGLTASYFSTPDLSGTPAATQTVPTVTLDAQVATVPAGAASVRWTGLLSVPKSDAYTFAIRASGGVQLWLGDEPKPVLDATPADEISSLPVALQAGQLYTLCLEVRQLTSPAVAELRWSSPATPKAVVPFDHLSPSSVCETFAAALMLLSKIALLVNTYKMTDKELVYFSTHASDFANWTLQDIPVDRQDPAATDQKAVALFTQWQCLNDFIRLRDSLPQGEVSLLDVFAAASVASQLIASPPTSPDTKKRQQDALDDTKRKLLAATGWETPTVDALTGLQAFQLGAAVSGFHLTVDVFTNAQWLLRLQACMRLVKRLGVAADHLFAWAAMPTDASQAQDIKRTVKALYDDETWLTVAKPLNDGLRESQREALVAYVLAEPTIIAHGITDANQLFEYFLIDVDMCACMATSRIKQAISSV
jgi:hypothetical protein